MSEKESKIKENPELTNEEKEKAKEEAKKEAEKVKKSIEEGKTTEWVDEKGNPIKPVTPGTYPAGSTPSYELVGTVINPETGKVTHIFKPVTKEAKTTVWVYVNGNPLKPTVPGTEEAGTVPKYKLVRTVTNPETGDVIHVFTPAPVVNNVTEWVDVDGNVIRTKEDGSQPAGKVPNYELVGTVKDPETGKVLHIFKPTTKNPVTVWVDVNGKPLKPLAEGSNPAGEVPGYELVGTKVDPETGNLLHVFKPKGSATPGINPGTPGTNPGMPGQNPGTPGTPGTSANPEKPMDPNAPPNPATPANPSAPATPTMPSAPVNGEAPQAAAASSEAKGQAELPNTGTEDNASLAALGLLGVLSGFGLVARKKKED